jgi:antitoxin component of RelBE/YafQ-DinJ toxin-antitoxin module
MFKRAIIITFIIVCAGVSLANDTDVNSLIVVKQIGDKYVSEADYWVIRSQALTELIPFLTSTRREAKGHYKALTDYIKYIGKGQEYLDSDIKGPSSPAEYVRLIGKAEEFEKNNVKLPEKYMTWDQLVELAMEFVVNEGYVPTDVNGPEEIEMFKQICERKEKYGAKVQTDLRKLAQDCMDMKAYLDSIDQFEACVKYTRYQKEEKEKARKEEMERRREDRAAVGRSKRETDKERREAIKEARREEAVEDRLALERRKRLGYTYYRGSYRYGYRRYHY